MIKANYHTHSTWCDGKDSPRKVIQAAIAKGFETIGFSSHAMLPQDDVDWVLTSGKAPRYANEIRTLAAEYKDRIRVLCGVEADYVPGGAQPSQTAYGVIVPDYIIGSIHFIKATDGAVFAIDDKPDVLADGIRNHFGGSSQMFVETYYATLRDMVANFDFDIVGHPDLVRKFNVKHPYFDERSDWYRAELVKTADAIAASGKLVEVNTGAIARGWLNDAYPSLAFRDLLRARGVKFVLSSDAHTADGIDCAFDRFGEAEAYVEKLKG